MNDLDLRTALHRDADLVGEPSPDLLDQLVRRRRDQHRRRVGLIAVAAAVVVIAAGIPVGASLVGRSHVAPATQTTSPTPSVPTGVPTPSATAPVTTTPSATAGPETSSVPVTSAPAADSETPPCLDAAGFRDVAQAANTNPNVEFRVIPPAPGPQWPAVPGPQCSGTWAVTDLDVVTMFEGQSETYSVPQLFRYVSGAWTPVERWKYCNAGQVPADIEYLPCETT